MTEKGKRQAMDFRTDSPARFLDDVLAMPYFEPGFMPHAREPGDSKLVVATGENATGKSFFRRVISAALKKSGVEPMPVSMELRAGGGIVSAFIFGDEGRQATGEVTANSVLGGFTTSAGRKNRHAIIWDEPDVGLSDDYAAGAGLEIRDFVEKSGEPLFLCVVSSHRKVLLEQLLPLKPHHVRFGDRMTLDEVVRSRPSPKRLEELRERSHALFLKLSKGFGL